MAGALIAGLLFVSILLVHFSTRARPIPRDKPLDVDDGLPLPEAGQASTVLSLTALFGGYLGIYLFVGVAGLAGLVVGTVLALLAIDRWIARFAMPTFDAFLSRVFGASKPVVALAWLLIGIQIVYAVSEMLILRDVARFGLGLRPDHATLVALCLATIGYFYVLLGGYAAVFRTDILQFGLLVILGALVYAVMPPISWDLVGPSRPGYWEMPLADSRYVRPIYQFIVALVIGFGFLITCPDVWKRVHLVNQRRAGRRRILLLTLSGIGPFVVLIPLATLTPWVPDGPTDVGTILGGLLVDRRIVVVAGLGLVASFLSAFNSSLIASVHVALVVGRKRVTNANANETPRFHWLMASFLLTVSLAFMASLESENAYLLAMVLLGPFAVAAGVLAGTNGAPFRLRNESLVWLAALGTTGWFFVLLAFGVDWKVPSTREMELLPVAALMTLLVIPISAGLCRRGLSNA